MLSKGANLWGWCIRWTYKMLSHCKNWARHRKQSHMEFPYLFICASSLLSWHIMCDAKEAAKLGCGTMPGERNGNLSHPPCDEHDVWDEKQDNLVGGKWSIICPQQYILIVSPFCCLILLVSSNKSVTSHKVEASLKLSYSLKTSVARNSKLLIPL